MPSVTSADGTLIDLELHGAGPAVVFVGGATQYRGVDTSTSEVARRLGDEGFAAAVYDRRGRGGSGDTPPWSLDREVEDLAAVIAHAGAPAALYTSSSGATVALAAVAAGVPVSALVLYEPPFFRNEQGEEQLAHLRALLAEGRSDEAMRYNMTSVIGVPAETVDGMAQSPWWPALVAVAPTLLYDLGAVHEVDTDPDWPRRWAGVTVPVTVMSGAESFPGMAQVADSVAAAIPHAERRVLAGQGHGPSADALVPALLEVLRPLSS